MTKRFYYPAILASLLLCLFFTHPVADSPELLEPTKAFTVEAQWLDSDSVQLNWTIAEGYYLYQHRFSFDGDDNTVWGKPIFSKAKEKNDEFFGLVKTYRGDTAIITLPLVSASTTPTLTLGSQGCADAGVCYVPQTTIVDLPPRPQAKSTANTSLAPSASPVLNLNSQLPIDLSANGDEELLDPDKAFIFQASMPEPDVIVAQWRIADGYYLYKDKFKLNLLNSDRKVLEPEFPAAELYEDKLFGNVEIYRNNVTLRYPLSGNSDLKGFVEVAAQFQGCADLGVCYPPINKTVSVIEAIGSSATDSQIANVQQQTTPSSQAKVSTQDALAAKLTNGNTALTLLLFVGLGILLAFTPCVLPMVPILSSIIVNQGPDISTKRSFIISLFYVIPMALTYAVAGVIMGMLGANIQVWFQNPWVIAVFASIMVGLAFSMFGFYELQMPGSIQNWLNSKSNQQKGGSPLGVSIMGVLSALVVGPCITAPLVGILIYIGQTGDPVIGGLALFSLGLGMGIPLLIVGTSLKAVLPKAGGWMEQVKALFGFILVGVAIWLVDRVVPGIVTTLLYSLLMIIAGFYFGAHKIASTLKTKWNILGALLVCAGIIFAGYGMATQNKPHEGLVFETIKSVEDLDNVLAKAAQQDRYVMFDFYADWCVSCKEMEHLTFTDPTVISLLENTTLIQADVTNNDEADQALLKRFGLFGPPAILFFPAGAEESKPYRVVGFLPADAFAQHIEEMFAAP